MQWKDEALEKLKRYGAMQQALQNIPEEIARLKADAAALRSPSGESISVKGGGGRREDALINNIAQRQELEWTLKQVKQWLAIADRGLAALTPEERLVLQRMYLLPERRAIDLLCTELGVEQATVYRKRDKALRRFTVALYGFLET
ncbi:MAG: DUF1492 domain-containing protein [Oscillospiraceae bacterium]|nr:DUF1492 domain-containing protein [Oscillospiraceae bacterium]